MLFSCNTALNPVVVTYYADRDEWELVDGYLLDCGDFVIQIPDGYRFDLASVPRFFWRVIAPFELSLVAPLVHDFIYEFKGRPPAGSISPPRTFTRREADDLFLHLMQREHVAPWRQIIAYRAVRLFGKF